MKTSVIIFAIFVTAIFLISIFDFFLIKILRGICQSYHPFIIVLILVFTYL